LQHSVLRRAAAGAAVDLYETNRARNNYCFKFRTLRPFLQFRCAAAAAIKLVLLPSSGNSARGGKHDFLLGI
jgi:hypothetical protein